MDIKGELAWAMNEQLQVISNIKQLSTVNVPYQIGFFSDIQWKMACDGPSF